MERGFAPIFDEAEAARAAGDHRRQVGALRRLLGAPPDSVYRVADRLRDAFARADAAAERARVAVSQKDWHVAIVNAEAALQVLPGHAAAEDLLAQANQGSALERVDHATVTWDAVTVKGFLGPGLGAVLPVFRRHQSELRDCYVAALAGRPDLAGQMTFKFVVSYVGKVHRVETVAGALDPALEACIVARIEGWQFPPSDGGVNVINLPLIFQSP